MTGRSGRAVLVGSMLLVALPAHAGMTVYGLRDVYRLRFQELSFFLLLFLVCTLALKFLWNHAVKGFPSLPRLKFFQAGALALLLGLVMLVILTMISGIREVLTPGAWRHQGTSYRLNDPAQEPARQRSLEHLRSALFQYAATHDGKFPANDFTPEIADKLWESPEQNGTHYIYSGGLTTGYTNGLLAIEPLAFGESRFVLLTDGKIERRSHADIEAWLASTNRP
jgi:hypothetical protein